MSEHHGSSSPEETSSEHESASDTSLDDGDAPITTHQYLKEEATGQLHAADNYASPIFPFSLLSACSAQGRAVIMCQYARSITSQDIVSSAKGTIGLKGE
jgi:hypothetical protein